MRSARYMDIYKGQDFFTPGAAETVDLISRTFPLDARARVIEVAYGTGEGRAASPSVTAAASWVSICIRSPRKRRAGLRRAAPATSPS